MNHQDPFPPPFRLYQWLVQPDLNRISGPDGPVRLEPRVMAVLLALAARPNQVVTRLELLDEVWGDTVVGEEILTRAVSELRRVFGDNARRPEFIETIRQNGYRLIAPVVAPDPDPESISPQVEPISGVTRVRNRRGSRLSLMVVGIVLSVLTVAGAYVLRHRDTKSAIDNSLPAVPLTSYSGREFHPALSPDGTRVAFAWSGPEQGHTAIYVKQRNSEAALQLSDDPGWAAWPAWSPDGQTVAFVQTAGTVSTIGLVPSLGGPVRWIRRVAGLIEGLDWSPDGTQLAFAARDTVSGRYCLFRCDLDVLRVTPIPVDRPDDAGDFQPRFGPQGRRLAWLGRDRAGGGSVFMAPAGGGEATMITSSLGKLQGLAWTSSGQALVYAAATDGVYRLWQVSTGNDRPHLIPIPGEFAWNPSISRDTGDLAFEQVRVDQDLWRVTVRDRHSWTVDAQPFVTSTRWESAADFRPDGTAIAFVSNRSGYPEIWLGDAQGEQLRRLTALGATAISNLLWAPTGDKLACNAVLAGVPRIVIADAVSGVTRQLSLGYAHEMFVAWGATGRDILVAASSVAAGWQIYRQGLAGGDPIRITRHGGLTAREGPDGRTLYFTRPDRPGLWRRSSGGRIAPELILPDLLPRDRFNWRLADGRIVWVMRTGSTALLMEYKLASHRSELLAELPGLQGSGLAVLAGKDVFVYPRRGEIAGDLMLITGGGQGK